VQVDESARSGTGERLWSPHKGLAERNDNMLEATLKQDVKAKHRMAKISIDVQENGRAVRVSHPGKLTPEEISRIDHVLINDVIKDLTGCACLSGTIDVIWEKQFDRVLDVQLGR
jgi:hypothetical protein